ncbi:hypothetical protein ACA910_007036 [Epithemia clementina (nom. ined.)]
MVQTVRSFFGGRSSGGCPSPPGPQQQPPCPRNGHGSRNGLLPLTNKTENKQQASTTVSSTPSSSGAKRAVVQLVHSSPVLSRVIRREQLFSTDSEDDDDGCYYDYYDYYDDYYYDDDYEEDDDVSPFLRFQTLLSSQFRHSSNEACKTVVDCFFYTRPDGTNIAITDDEDLWTAFSSCKGDELVIKAVVAAKPNGLAEKKIDDEDGVDTKIPMEQLREMPVPAAKVIAVAQTIDTEPAAKETTVSEAESINPKTEPVPDISLVTTTLHPTKLYV